MTRLSLADVIAALRARYGAPARLEPKTAFEMVVFENASYLVADDIKRAVFDELARRIGTTPAAILGARRQELVAAIAHGGMLPAHRADKLVAAADAAPADLEARVKLDLASARKALKPMPSIGAPGADKIALFVGGHDVLPLDSNGIRVLARLGFAREDPSYIKAYRAVQTAVTGEHPPTARGRIAAHLLLRTHGKTTCTRARPACGACPLAASCPTAA